MASQPSPFVDQAEPILRGDPALDDATRASLWDAFHSKNADELVQHLQPLPIPDDTKHKLWTAKLASTPVAPPLDKVTAAISRIKQIDPDTLEVAEAHPNVLKALTSAATAPEKAAGEPAGASKAASKGSTPQTAKKAPAVPLDTPATPAGHALVQTSDGGLYHVPAANIDRARQIDPKLKVLHAEPDEA